MKRPCVKALAVGCMYMCMHACILPRLKVASEDSVNDAAVALDAGDGVVESLLFRLENFYFTAQLLHLRPQSVCLVLRGPEFRSAERKDPLLCRLGWRLAGRQTCTCQFLGPS